MDALRPEAKAHLRRLALALVAMGATARHAGLVDDPAEALGPLLDAALDILGTPPGAAGRSAALLLADGTAGGHLAVAAVAGPARPVPVHASLDAIAHDLLPRRVDDCPGQADILAENGKSPIRSAIFAPLSWNGKYFGALYCGATMAHTYSDDDLSVLGGLADLAALVWIARRGAPCAAG